MGDPVGEVTQLLESWREGDREAFARLVPLVYDELHRIAVGLMRHERRDHTLQATALVSELYLRLVNQRKMTFHDREHFYTFTARVMRNILIDYARTRMAERRAGKERIDLPLPPDLIWIGCGDEQLLDLDRALDRLEQIDARKARLIELRFFLSFTTEEACDILQISHATAERDLKFARSWLYRELRGGEPHTESDAR